MNRDTLQARWSEIDPLIDSLEDLEPSQRAAWLDQHRVDAELRSAVLDLLASQPPQGESPLDRARDVLHPPEALRCGSEIGDYRLISVLGSGGMATVFLAERRRAGVVQRVAFKLMRSGIYDPALQALFHREQRILARLEHPGIARLIDAGITPANVPFLVMEYVEGVSIDRYCEDHALDVPARLRMMIGVCDAVAYSHRHLLVHRDLKPANILATADGTVRLLDFGIAKLLDEGEAATRTLQHRATPAYAAPEQFSSEAPTTATDVYALGVILCELLTRRRPQFRADGSLRLPSTVPDARDPSERSLRNQLRGDLDAIVAHALQPAPESRYPDAASLSEDLQRHLNGLPVHARAEAWSYRASRFLKRHRYGMLALSGSMLALIVGLIATAIGFDRARDSAFEARMAEQRSSAINRFLRELLIAPRSANLGADARVVDVLRDAENRLALDRDLDPVVRGSLEGLLGETHVALGDAAHGSTLLERGRSRLRDIGADASTAALEIETTLLEIDAEQCRLATAKSRLGELQVRMAARPAGQLALRTTLVGSMLAACEGNHAGADALASRALERATPNDYPDEFTWAVQLRAQSLAAQGKFSEAEAAMRDALAALAPLQDAIRRFQIQNSLVEILHARGELQEAERFARDNVATVQRLHGSVPHPQKVVAESSLASVLMERGNWAESLAGIERALADLRTLSGDQDVGVLELRGNRANVLKSLGRFEEAEAEYRDIVGKLGGLGAPAQEAHLRHAFNLAELLNERRRFDAARQVAEPAWRDAVRVLGTGNLVTLELRDALAIARLETGGLREAESMLRQSLAEKTELLGGNSPYTLAAGYRLADTLQRLGANGESRAVLERVIAGRIAILGADHAETRAAQELLARIGRSPE